MTGMRVGYLVAPSAVASTAAKLEEPLIACVNAPAQYAALAALEGPQDTSRRCGAPIASGATRRPPSSMRPASAISFPGAPSTCADVRDRCGADVKSWALELLRERHVAVAPGTTFGGQGEGWARISLATDTGDLLEGLDRLAGVEARS